MKLPYLLVLNALLLSLSAHAATAPLIPAVTTVPSVNTAGAALPTIVPPSPALNASSTIIPFNTGQNFLERYPLLRPNIYVEPPSNISLGFSVGILGLVKDRMFFSANFFQIHYASPHFDNEILSISYGSTTANPSYVQSNHFIFRTIPKYKVSNFLSVGPLFGYEFVSFPSTTDVLYNGIKQTKSQPFSSQGIIYGVGATENFKTEKAYNIRVNELFYQETYSTQDAGKGWSYLYDSTALRSDPTPIKAGFMMLIEVGMLY